MTSAMAELPTATRPNGASLSSSWDLFKGTTTCPA
jgi:hypothetical protein